MSPRKSSREISHRSFGLLSWRAAVIAALLIAGVFTVYQLTSGSAAGSAARTDPHELDLAAQDPTLARTHFASASENPGDPEGLHSVDFEELLEDYQRWAQYPPNSRPLRREHVDVLEHHWVNIPARTMTITNDQGEVINTGIECRLQPARHSITEKESQQIVLYCQNAGQETMSALRIRSHSLTRSAADQQTAVAAEKLTVNDAGKQGDERAADQIYTFQFTPDRNDWGDIYLETAFEIAGRPGGEVHTMRTHFYSSPTAPAKFTGNFREGVRDGSLIVAAEVLVEDAGRFTIEANLFAEPETEANQIAQPETRANLIAESATEAQGIVATAALRVERDEVPVAYARADARLRRGLQWVELEFFGKVLHDANQPGPYVLRGLRGVQNTGPIDPARLDGTPEEVEAYLATIHQDRPARKQLPYYTSGYLTRPYDLSEFSRTEYDSPAKRERIATIQELMAQKESR
ncbi:MAG: hypothetical protein NXI24_22355 [bacterium]|nr:hypothetical protein [bacterium]